MAAKRKRASERRVEMSRTESTDVPPRHCEPPAPAKADEAEAGVALPYCGVAARGGRVVLSYGPTQERAEDHPFLTMPPEMARWMAKALVTVARQAEKQRAIIEWKPDPEEWERMTREIFD